MDVSVSTQEPTPPGATDAAFAAGAATVIAADARETAETAAAAAVDAAQEAAQAARAAERVQDQAIDAQITAESVDARLGDFVEEFREFRDDMIEIMNDAAAGGTADLGLPPLEDGNDGGDQADKPTPTRKPKEGKHYLDRWFGGR